jgi:copper chaperone
VETVEFKCDGMFCSGCEQTITKEVNKLDGIKEVVADFKAKFVKVTFAGNVTNKDAIRKAINDAGYDTEDSKSSNPHECDTNKMKENKQ